jgi:hypothetical protein
MNFLQRNLSYSIEEVDEALTRRYVMYSYLGHTFTGIRETGASEEFKLWYYSLCSHLRTGTGKISIVVHPLDPKMLTIEKCGKLIPCVNGRTVVELNSNIFKFMVHETSGHKFGLARELAK